MNRSYTKIRHIQESNLLLEKRLLSEKTPVTTNTTTTPPIAKPTQSYQQILVDKYSVSNDSMKATLPSVPITATITPKGSGNYQLNVNNLSNKPIMVNKGVITPPLSNFHWVQSLKDMLFGTVTITEQNELSTAITKSIKNVVKGLPRA